MLPRCFQTTCFALVFVLTLLAVQVSYGQKPTWQLALSTNSNSTLGSSDVRAMAADAAGNVYVAGEFDRSITLGTTTLTSLGETDVFVAKWSPLTGDFVWAVRGGGSTGDYATALVVSGSNVYVAGVFASPTAGFGPLNLVNPVLPPSTSSEGFVVKLSDSGSFVWAQRAGGVNHDAIQALAVSGTSVYIAGYFGGFTANFGATTLTLPGFLDMSAFVAKLTDSGLTSSYEWAQPLAGGAASALAARGPLLYAAGGFGVAKLTDTGNVIWVQPANAGNVSLAALTLNGPDLYIGGSFSGVATPFNSPPLLSAGRSDAFVAKLTDVGTSLLLRWAQRAGGSGSDYVAGLVTRGTSVYATGEFTGAQADFGATLVGDIGAPDLFVTKLNDAGSTASFEWVQTAGSASNDRSSGIVAVGTRLYIAGHVFLPATFGSHALSGPDKRFDGFVAALQDPLRIAGDARLCPGGQLTLTAPGGAVSYQWNTGATTPEIIIKQVGLYAVVCTFPDGSLVTLQQQVSSFDPPPPTISGDSVGCAGSLRHLEASAPGATAYRWNTGATTATLTTTVPGSYTVVVSFANGCTSRARRQVRDQAPLLPFTLGADTTLCQGEAVTLRPSTLPVEGTYRWSDGSTGASVRVTQPGMYSVQVSTACGSYTAQRHVNYRSCLQIPNIITPNGDKLNDSFVIIGLPAGQVEMTIYTRWGSQIFRTKDYHNEWGPGVPAGIYYYWLRETTTGHSYQGWVEVIY
jgi:gliding motility-associated-like protein